MVTLTKNDIGRKVIINNKIGIIKAIGPNVNGYDTAKIELKDGGSNWFSVSEFKILEDFVISKELLKELIAGLKAWQVETTKTIKNLEDILNNK